MIHFLALLSPPFLPTLTHHSIFLLFFFCTTHSLCHSIFTTFLVRLLCAAMSDFRSFQLSSTFMCRFRDFLYMFQEFFYCLLFFQQTNRVLVFSRLFIEFVRAKIKVEKKNNNLSRSQYVFSLSEVKLFSFPRYPCVSRMPNIWSICRATVCLSSGVDVNIVKHFE